ncbi:phosphoglycerate dehydrogenase [Roseisolibacter sp. H3M3-2]|uniref:phosphoglycerate dehydrogenase n=1 Tax=Roseisolibacter sp. H3M3-2 TaxID=3031323 RepID=UPI0023DB8ED8|nr:phosphoglycerate dehydrogenase [Roseisolibacter sp. H3M3-2]MDF1501565.1 phosphoglycerate dehydrogenase [Roseisolibacter sp. H3M3-2]
MPYRVLVTDDIDRDGVALLEAEPQLRVDEVPTLPPATLLERIGEYDAIIGRSATKISAELLRHATRLRVVGRAGVGVDNVAMDVATELGVAVINAPAGNTVAVAELFFGTTIGLLRQLGKAWESMRAGRWDRGALMGAELKGKTLGIVGLGRIGGEVAVRAHAFGMELVAYDPYVADARFGALRVRRAASLDDLLDEADIVTVHTPLTDETQGMIGRRELARLRAGAIVCNLARGGIVDDAALQAALEAGHLKGAVLDVFAAEPLAADHPLRHAPNVVLTPHVGANTAEAQRNVAVDVCAAVRDALLRGELSRSMNVAAAAGGWGELQPAMLVARRAAAVARAILADMGVRAVQRLTVRCGSAVAGGQQLLLSAAALGAVEGVVEHDRLNLINARALAEARGLELTAGESGTLAPSAIEVSLRGAMQELTVAGAAPNEGAPRLTRIGAFHVDVNPRQSLIVLTNRDVPGVIGRVGTLLGDAGVNIAEYHQARLAQGGEALAVISVDGKVDASVRQRLCELPDVQGASVVRFRGE